MYELTKVNEYFWRKYTTESSVRYKEKMLNIENIEGDESLIIGKLHGSPVQNHWMFKLENYQAPHGIKGVYYEFLIEYDIWQPELGIYYGVKCITDIYKFPPFNYENHIKSIDIANDDWQKLRKLVVKTLNQIFIGKDFESRIKLTNNANDNTYWPFWISLYEDEDINQVGLKALKQIRHIYELYLSGELDKLVNSDNIIASFVNDTTKKKRNKDEKAKGLNLRFTKENFNEAEEEIADRIVKSIHIFLIEIFSKKELGIVEEDLKKSAKGYFETFISKSKDLGWITQDPLYAEVAYRFVKFGENSEGNLLVAMLDTFMLMAAKKLISECRHKYRDKISEKKNILDFLNGVDEEKIMITLPSESLCKILIKKDGEELTAENMRNMNKVFTNRKEPSYRKKYKTWKENINELMGW